MPEVVAAYEKLHTQGFEVLGISIDEAGKKERIEEILTSAGVTWPQIYDGEGGQGSLPTRNGVRAIPASFLLDRGGEVRYTNLEGAELEQRVRELLAGASR